MNNALVNKGSSILNCLASAADDYL